MNFLKKLLLTIITISVVASISLTLMGCPPAAPVAEETTPEETAEALPIEEVPPPFSQLIEEIPPETLTAEKATEITPVEGVKGELAVEFYTLSLISLDGGSPRSLGFHLATFSTFHWSPDGQKIVFIKFGDVWVINIDTNQIENITNTPEHYEEYPCFSPDGKMIAFISSKIDPGADVFDESKSPVGSDIGRLTLVNSDGTNYRVLDSQPVKDFTWSPDSRQIAYSIDGDLYIFSLDTNQFNHISLVDYGLSYNFLACSPAWSPQGDAIAIFLYSKHKLEEKSIQHAHAILYLTDHTSKIIKSYTTTATMAYEGHPIGEHIGGCAQRPALWSPSGKWLLLTINYIPRTDLNHASCWLIDSHGEQVRSLGSTIYGVASIDWSPDEKWVAFIDGYDSSLRVVNPMNPEEEYQVIKGYNEEGFLDIGAKPCDSLAWRPIKNKQ